MADNAPNAPAQQQQAIRPDQVADILSTLNALSQSLTQVSDRLRLVENRPPVAANAPVARQPLSREEIIQGIQRCPPETGLDLMFRKIGDPTFFHWRGTLINYNYAFDGSVISANVRFPLGQHGMENIRRNDAGFFTISFPQEDYEYLAVDAVNQPQEPNNDVMRDLVGNLGEGGGIARTDAIDFDDSRTFFAMTRSLSRRIALRMAYNENFKLANSGKCFHQQEAQRNFSALVDLMQHLSVEHFDRDAPLAVLLQQCFRNTQLAVAADAGLNAYKVAQAHDNKTDTWAAARESVRKAGSFNSGRFQRRSGNGFRSRSSNGEQRSNSAHSSSGGAKWGGKKADKAE